MADDGVSKISSSKLTAAYKYAVNVGDSYLGQADEAFTAALKSVQGKVQDNAVNDITAKEASIVRAMAKGGNEEAQTIVNGITKEDKAVYKLFHPTSTTKKVLIAGGAVGGTSVVGGIALSQFVGTKQDVENADLP